MDNPSFITPPGKILRTGFTLVELLAVIAIVGILAAIIIPVAGYIRKSAANTTCQNNLRQLGVAFKLYAVDNGYYPAGINSASVPWHRHMRPYLAGGSIILDDQNLNSEVVVCPARTLTPADDQLRRSSYSVHPLIMPAMNESGRQLMRPRAIQRENEIILAADGTQQSHGGANAQFYSLAAAQLTDSNYTPDEVLPDGPDADGVGGAWFRFRHGGKVHVVYVDGHIGDIAKGAVRQRNVRVN